MTVVVILGSFTSTIRTGTIIVGYYSSSFSRLPVRGDWRYGPPGSRRIWYVSFFALACCAAGKSRDCVDFVGKGLALGGGPSMIEVRTYCVA